MASEEPRISVITATYNRSDVLRYTIAALLRSTFEDWEQIVVGDGCTDDTEAVVRSFGDPRIRFTNLPANTGDEAQPHNHGLALARAPYVAYLNHDDLWLPEHLHTALAGLAATGADLVWTLSLSVLRDGPNLLDGVLPDDVYRPLVPIPQSTWLVRRELLEEVGPWRQHHEVWTEPAQDLLVRAWRRRKRIRCIPRITVVRVAAGRRHDAYRRPECDDSAHYFERIEADPRFVEREFLGTIPQVLWAARELRKVRVGHHLSLAMRNLWWGLAMKLGLAPVELAARFRYRRRGAIIDAWREKVGLPVGRTQR